MEDLPVRTAISWGLVLWLGVGVAAADSARVTARTANVRYGPSADTRAVAQVARGAVLEVVETSGDWHKVRSADGAVEGWIRSHLVEIVRSGAARPAAPPPATAGSTAAPAPAPPPPTASSAGVVIDHTDVACLVVGESTQLRACLSPAEGIGKAQVHFRAMATSPWYSVELKPDGPCHSTWLPRPMKETREVEYFVFVIDRQFDQTSRPDDAPSGSFTPRVVARKPECMKMMAASPAMGGAGMAPQNIVVSAARNATGGLLDTAAAQGVEATGGLPGFSPRGVVMSSTGQPPAPSGQSMTAQAHHGIPKVALIGGAVAAAGVGVAVAAGGGGGSGSSSSGSGGGSNTSSQGPSTQPASLTGSWGGLVANNAGLTLRAGVPGGSCTFLWDVDLTLTQNGNALTGPGRITFRSVSCSVPGAENAIGGGVLPGETFDFAATLAPPSAISVPLGSTLLTGTYSATAVRVTGSQAQPGGSLDYTLAFSKR
jgi:hypothetical protein